LLPAPHGRKKNERSYPFFVDIRCSATTFFSGWGSITHFQNQLKETLGMPLSSMWGGALHGQKEERKERNLTATFETLCALCLSAVNDN